MNSKTNWRTILWIIAGLLFIAGVIPIGIGIITKLINNPGTSLTLEIQSLLVIIFFVVGLFMLGHFAADLSIFRLFEYDFSSPRHKRKRQALIDYVRDDWVKGV